jgi:hypothetical protein
MLALCYLLHYFSKEITSRGCSQLALHPICNSLTGIGTLKLYSSPIGIYSDGSLGGAIKFDFSSVLHVKILLPPYRIIGQLCILKQILTINFS